MVAGLKNLSYVQRLERLYLTTLEETRLVEMYKLLTEKQNVDYGQFFRKEYVVIVTRCSFPASEQLSGNRSSATESWTVGTQHITQDGGGCGYCADVQSKT